MGFGCSFAVPGNHYISKSSGIGIAEVVESMACLTSGDVIVTLHSIQIANLNQAACLSARKLVRTTRQRNCLLVEKE